MTENVGCREFRDRAPELALGLVGGDELGAAIDHLATCGACQAHLEELMRVADLLLLLAPSVDPEIGFESRVMDRLAAEGAFSSPTPEAARVPLPRRRRRFMVVASAAAVIVLVSGIAGLVARRGGAGPGRPPEVQKSDTLTPRAIIVRADGGRSICRLVAFPGAGAQPARIVVDLEEPGDSTGSYQVLAQPAVGGPAILVGMIATSGGHGMLSTSIPPGLGAVNAVDIVEGPGTVKYRATFAPT